MEPAVRSTLKYGVTLSCPGSLRGVADGTAFVSDRNGTTQAEPPKVHLSVAMELRFLNSWDV